MESPRDISPSERGIAAFCLSLLADQWTFVHRRVEAITLEDVTTIGRRVSVDFTLPYNVDDKLAVGKVATTPVFVVPIALLRKGRLRRFDLRDERDEALPLLTAAKNGAVAAAVLEGACRVLARPRLKTRQPLPRAIRDDLWVIATGTPSNARAKWLHLGDVSDAATREEVRWRRAMVLSSEFMSLARDLSQNFMVLTPLATGLGQRRVVKMSYEEMDDRTSLPTLLGMVPKEIKVSFVRFLGRLGNLLSWVPKHSWRLSRSVVRNVGFIEVQIVASQRAAIGQTHVRIAARADSHEDERTRDGPGRMVWSGRPGGYGISTVGVPAELLVTSLEPGEVTVRRGKTARCVITLAPRASFLELETASNAAISTIARIGLRFIGWSPDHRTIRTPALGQGGSYHVEFDAPEGLQIVRSRLAAYSLSHTSPPLLIADDSENGPLKRTHLYLAGISPNDTGLARFDFSPRSSTVVGPATVAAAITFGLLLGLSLRLTATDLNVGPIVALLLVIPGGLSLYVSRPPEHLVTGALLLGVRLLAASSALWAFAAAAVIVFDRRWYFKDQLLQAGPAWSSSGAAIWIMTAAAFATLLVLLVACIRARFA